MTESAETALGRGGLAVGDFLPPGLIPPPAKLAGMESSAAGPAPALESPPPPYDGGGPSLLLSLPTRAALSVSAAGGTVRRESTRLSANDGPESELAEPGVERARYTENR